MSRYRALSIRISLMLPWCTEMVCMQIPILKTSKDTDESRSESGYFKLKRRYDDLMRTWWELMMPWWELLMTTWELMMTWKQFVIFFRVPPLSTVTWPLFHSYKGILVFILILTDLDLWPLTLTFIYFVRKNCNFKWAIIWDFSFILILTYLDLWPWPLTLTFDIDLHLFCKKKLQKRNIVTSRDVQRHAYKKGWFSWFFMGLTLILTFQDNLILVNLPCSDAWLVYISKRYVHYWVWALTLTVKLWPIMWFSMKSRDVKS